ncbi:ROK family protein [Microbacterium sp. cx-59]|uniref:ROK family transcriptional regulator n=1 Tax=Microbacterium sp. cx-59 TaxID=2891207 RepID=UPI001E365F68|nr:ROK family protein [Microbacterium sp. cx-59]MCC4909432.1 ROK family protein [Microbacterium sp. cx-59]
MLKHILLRGETTRAEIVAEIGLSAASAANIVVELIDDGLVEERGSKSSRGGRPITIVGPRTDAAVTVGIDVGERGVAAELFDLSMNRIDREFRGGHEAETAPRIAADIAAALDALRSRHPARWGTLVGVGLGLPGIVETDADGIQTVYAQSLGWEPVAVTRLCAVDAVPVIAENGATLQARAELWFGNAKDSQHAIVAQMGRGIGMGLVINGEIATGSRSSATEWGHTTLQVGGALCRCGNRGCVEAYLGADAILRRWKDTGADVPGSGWSALGALIDSAEEDPAARALIIRVIDELGAALGSMVNLNNPERVLIGGWVGERLLAAYAEEIDAAITAHALHRPASQYRLMGTRFAGDSVAVGAGLLPLDALITTGWTVARAG